MQTKDVNVYISSVVDKYSDMVYRTAYHALCDTHYAEDIIPEIERLLLIKDGSVHADGSKEELLCDEAMSSLFDVPMSVAEVTPGHYSLTSEY